MIVANAPPYTQIQHETYYLNCCYRFNSVVLNTTTLLENSSTEFLH